MSIKTESYARLPDLLSAIRETLRAYPQLAVSTTVDEDGRTLYELSRPHNEEELGPEGPDGGNSPHLYADEERRAA